MIARLTRIRTLVDTLEKACSESDEQRSIFLKLKREMDALR